MVRVQVYVVAALTPALLGCTVCGNNWYETWVGSRAGEDADTKEKSLSFLGIERRLCSPQPATLLTATQTYEAEGKVSLWVNLLLFPSANQMYEIMEVKLHIYLFFSLSGNTFCIAGWVDPRLRRHAVAKVNTLSCWRIKDQLDVTCYFISFLCASACNTDTIPTQPRRNSNTHRTKNNTTNVVIQQNSHKLLMMDILMSEICWAHEKWNKIACFIKLVVYS